MIQVAHGAAGEGLDGSARGAFRREEETWFASKARGLTRRPSCAPSAPPPAAEPSHLDDSIFDRWVSAAPEAS